MLRLIALTTVAMGLVFAETTSVPKGATEIEPGVFKHTESSGKTFIYRKSPFGIVKSPEVKTAEQGAAKSEARTATTAAAPVASKAGPGATASPFGDVKKDAKAQDIRVHERGEVLEFERPSPFGGYRWKRNKAELTPEEQEAWSRARAQQTPSKSTGPKE